MRMFKILFVITCLPICNYSCKNDIIVSEINDYNYFPVNKGHYVIYQVDSIVYNDFTNTVDTFLYEIKEYIESDIIDNSGRTVQRLEKYKRNCDTLPWKLNNVWTCLRTTYTAEKVEENVRYLKLIFPIQKDKKWNGNAYNIFDEQTYKYIDVHKPYYNKYLYFDSTITVLQKDFNTLISNDYAIEIYATGVGLVYKKFVQIEKEITGVIKKGVDYTMTAKQYGN
ncbi:MAG TPA: hypothetical protein P5250_05875 [Bacteroidales bacterium]|nr:hypothetical protein [Bacteroidales bacterium]